MGTPHGFYPSDTSLQSKPLSINTDSKLRSVLLDTEFDCYSDLSIDSSSSFSFDSSEYLNYAIQGQLNPFPRSVYSDETLMQYGGNLTLSETANSSLWSDDEDTIEFHPFDQTIRLSHAMMEEEEEERRYLQELVHRDMMAAELGSCFPSPMEDSCWSIEPSLHDLPADFFPITGSILNELHDNVTPNRDRVSCRDGLENLYRDDSQAKCNPNVNTTLANPNSRNNNICSKVQMDEKVGSTETTKPEKDFPCKPAKKTKVKKIKPANDGEQRIFLGGLPVGITERMLRQHLAAQGYKVLKRPKILHGFAPEVWMRTAEATDLIGKGMIVIDGLEVEVRPYNSLTKLSELKKLPNVGKRSVFIGGLSSTTTTKKLQDALLEMGMKVINYPVIKHGFARQVILDTISQAKSLIKMKKIKINRTLVDVRPYVNQKRRRKTK